MEVFPVEEISCKRIVGIGETLNGPLVLPACAGSSPFDSATASTGAKTRAAFFGSLAFWSGASATSSEAGTDLSALAFGFSGFYVRSAKTVTRCVLILVGRFPGIRTLDVRLR